MMNDVPHAVGLTQGNGGGKAFEHFRATGKYIWKGNEYTDPPHQLEVDTNRGVMYMHNLLSGITALRVCRIPDDLIHLFEAGTVVIDLVHTPERRGGKKGKIIKKEPAFFSIEANSFGIVDEAGLVYFEFRNVPDNLIKELWLGHFIDITLGFTGRTPSNPTPTGTCYEDAWRFLIKEEEGYLVHGSVQLSAEGSRVNHAWVELSTGYVWETQTKNYYTTEGFSIMNPVEVHRYTSEQAAIMAARTGNMGPWSDEERATWLGGER